MATSYTSLYQIFNDSALYYIVRKGGVVTLGHMASINRQRWPWLVSNYSEYKKRFEAAANGNLELMQSLHDLTRYVEGYKLGNTKINPFDNESNLVSFKPFMEMIALDEIGLTPSETGTRDIEIERINSLEVEDFKNMLSFMR